MTAKELIEILEKFDPETPVGIGDSFDGGYMPIELVDIIKSDTSTDWVRLYY